MSLLVFLGKTFKYEPNICNDCHHLKQKDINVNDLAIISAKGSDYRIHIWYRSKNDALNAIKNYKLNKTSGLVNLFFLI